MITQGNFHPEMYISIGETGAMFTLRQTYLHERWYRGEGGQPMCETEIRSFHIKNLGQQKDIVISKAITASKGTGVPMTTTMQILEAKEEMRKIERSTPEMMAEQEHQQRLANAQKHREWAEENDARVMDRLTFKGNKWLVGFGKYANMTFAKAIALDPSYFEWLLENNLKDDKYNNDTQNAMIELFLARAEPPVESSYFGEVGKRTNGITATVTFMKDFYTEWGVSTLVILKTPEGQELSLFTSVTFPEVGKSLTMNAMIADHYVREGVMQTKLKRPTKVEEVA